VPEPESRSNRLAPDRRTPTGREILQTDVQAAYEGDPASTSYNEIIVSYPCVEAIAIQRLAHILYRDRLPLIPRIMTEWAHGRTGIDIHPGAEIGSHFFIDHGTGVVIGETCRFGSHVKLYHGVTLGARSFQKDDAGKNQKKAGSVIPTWETGLTIYPKRNHPGWRNRDRIGDDHRRQCLSNGKHPARFIGQERAILY